MAGKICVLDIDVQGAESVKKSSLKPIYIFIAPPSVKVLETRLRGRGSENEESLKKRLGNSFKELEYSEQKGNFDQIFVNDDLMNTLEAMVFAFKEWYPHLVEDESLAIATDEQRSCAEKKCIIS
jgi:guanylate kinase